MSSSTLISSMSTHVGSGSRLTFLPSRRNLTRNRLVHSAAQSCCSMKVVREQRDLGYEKLFEAIEVIGLRCDTNCRQGDYDGEHVPMERSRMLGGKLRENGNDRRFVEEGTETSSESVGLGWPWEEIFQIEIPEGVLRRQGWWDCWNC